MRRIFLLPLLSLLLLTGCGREAGTVSAAPQTTAAATGTTETTGPETTTATTTTTTTNVWTPPAAPSLTSRLNAMTLEEKAGQMILACCSDEYSAEAAARGGAGGLCLFAPPFADKTQLQVRQMTQRLQNAAPYPLLIAVDEEGGTVNRVSLNPQLRAAPFASPRWLIGQGGAEALLRNTKEKARFLLTLGINVNLAPVCDVPSDANDYIAPRCFSMDAEEAAGYASMVVSNMKQSGLGSCLKHFPGYGGSADTHRNMAYDTRDYSAFTESDFKPFAAGIAAGADSVMVTHNIVQCMDPDYPASLSPEVHRILREELGFRGVIISDDLGMNAISQFTGGQNPAVAAVLAGNDLLCYADFDSSVQAIAEAVRHGLLKEEQLNDSVLRILAWKQSLGLL